MAKTIQPFSFLLTVIVFLHCSSGSALSKKFYGFSDESRGYGFLLGEPTLATYTRFTGWKTAWMYSAGFSFDKVVVANFDRLWYFYNAEDKLRDVEFWNSLLFYAGVGLRGGVGLPGADINNNYQIGARVIGGAEYIFINSPWSVKMEFSPTFTIHSKDAFMLCAGVGFNYYWYDGAKPAPAVRLGSPSVRSAPPVNPEFAPTRVPAKPVVRPVQRPGQKTATPPVDTSEFN